MAFACAHIGSTTYLLAAHGSQVLVAPLQVHSVRVENSLQTKGRTDGGDQKTPAVNKLLNYFHATVDRFPVDDALSVVLWRANPSWQARSVQLHLCCGAPTSWLSSFLVVRFQAV